MVNQLSNDQTPPVSLSVKLWTIPDFEKAKKRDIRNNIIQIAVGWVLMIAFGFLFGGKVLKGGTVIGWIGFSMMIIGIWFGLLKWIYGSMPEQVVKKLASDPSAWRKQARENANWFSDVNCPSCKQKVKVNVGYLQYNCQECGTPITIRTSDPPAKTIMGEESCPICHKTTSLQNRPAQFVCPNCNSNVELENIPILELVRQMEKSEQ